jgi:hypothetical protein
MFLLHPYTVWFLPKNFVFYQLQRTEAGNENSTNIPSHKPPRIKLVL